MLLILPLLFFQVDKLEREIANKLAADAISNLQETGKFPESVKSATSLAREMILPLYVGKIGYFKRLVRVKVLRVIDEQTMMVFMTDGSSSGLRLEPETLIMIGVPTGIYADNDSFFSDKVFVISDIAKVGKFGGRYRIVEPVSNSAIAMATEKVNAFLADVKEKEEKKMNEENIRMAKAKQRADEIKAEQEKAEIQEKQAKAKDSITKLIKALDSAEKRFADSKDESNPQIARQMADQATIYIQNSPKRLADAAKALDAAGVSKTDKKRLIAEVNDAINKAKKTVGVP